MKIRRLLLPLSNGDQQKTDGFRNSLRLSFVILSTIAALLGLAPLAQVWDVVRPAAAATAMAVPTAVSTPALLADINANPVGSIPTRLTPVNGRIFFAATDDSHGSELWASDNTITGTQLVADLYPGIAGTMMLAELNPYSDFGPFEIIARHGRVFFTGTDPLIGEELWGLTYDTPTHRTYLPVILR